MISVSVKEKAYGSSTILGKISFDVSAGETVALLGPSGVGKTTLLRIISGLDPNFDGSVNRPNNMAMVFQEPTLLNWRTSLQNLTLVTGISETAAKAAMDDVGLSGKEHLYPLQLSLGQRRRLALARAFAVQPDLLIMDEPFASLDPARIRMMIGLTKTLLSNRKIATLLVTHSEEEALLLADRVLRLEGSPAILSP